MNPSGNRSVWVVGLIAVTVIAVSVLVWIWYFQRTTIPSASSSSTLLKIVSSTVTASGQTGDTLPSLPRTSIAANSISSAIPHGGEESVEPSGNNRSSLHLDSAGYPLLLTDPLGRHIGYNATSGNAVPQIPNSEYSTQAIAGTEDQPSQSQPDYFIDLHSPLPGAYNLLLIGGQGTSSYELTMVTFAVDGSRQSTEELRGDIAGGSDLLFQINFEPSAQASSTIDRIN
jgi:hypothetical protein